MSKKLLLISKSIPFPIQNMEGHPWFVQPAWDTTDWAQSLWACHFIQTGRFISHNYCNCTAETAVFIPSYISDQAASILLHQHVKLHYQTFLFFQSVINTDYAFYQNMYLAFTFNSQGPNLTTIWPLALENHLTNMNHQIKFRML